MTLKVFLSHDWASVSLRQDSDLQLYYTYVRRSIIGCFIYADIVFCKAFYYTKAEYGTRIASWFGFAAVAGAFGGLLAYGIQNVKISISNWRLLFIIEVRPPYLHPDRL